MKTIKNRPVKHLRWNCTIYAALFFVKYSDVRPDDGLEFDMLVKQWFLTGVLRLEPGCTRCGTKIQLKTKLKIK